MRTFYHNLVLCWIAIATSLYGGEITVKFSPASLEESHLRKVQKWLSEAESSIDLALYSWRANPADIIPEVESALARGVKVRAVLEGASKDLRREDGGLSKRLEDAGATVRYTTKIMHHKFALIDADSENAKLISGSANWTSSAAARYDENTLFVRGADPLVDSFISEFATLWNFGKDFEFLPEEDSNPQFESFSDELTVSPASTEDGSVRGAYFTSDNFKMSRTSRGPRLSLRRNSSAVRDELISLISSARSSIQIASGHLRSGEITAALIAAKNANPSLDIKVYLDAAEYISKHFANEQDKKLERCETEATTPRKRAACDDKGYLFSYNLYREGIEVRFKSYAYRWHYSYAEQMHHKYMVIDNQTLATGSYNYSHNAEFSSLENLIVLSGEDTRSVIEDYTKNFESIWKRGRGNLESLQNEVKNAESIPLVFDSISLDWPEVTDLKKLIRSNCSRINSTEMKRNPARYRYCRREAVP